MPGQDQHHDGLDPAVIALRNVWVQYTGVIGISVMSVAMVVATRPRWLESSQVGLDKTYRFMGDPRHGLAVMVESTENGDSVVWRVEAAIRVGKSADFNEVLSIFG